MEEHLAQGHARLPVIANLCLYAGKQTPYPYSTDIYDCFEEPELARRTMFKPLHLIDLNAETQEELAGHGQADLLFGYYEKLLLPCTQCFGQKNWLIF